MIVASRRSLILGITSLVAAPSLVKATSLMDLSGYLMDPRVVAFRSGSGWLPSAVNDILNVPRDPFRAMRVIGGVFPQNYYELKRQSELNPTHYSHNFTVERYREHISHADKRLG